VAPRPPGARQPGTGHGYGPKASHAASVGHIKIVKWHG
jgi:hypothetical protein